MACAQVSHGQIILLYTETEQEALFLVQVVGSAGYTTEVTHSYMYSIVHS